MVLSIFDLQSGLKLVIWNRKDIAHEANINHTAASPTEFMIGHNVGSEEEVDMIMEQAREAGAIITVPAHDALWGGYSGNFQIN